MKKITFFQRKSRKLNFSLEFIFDEVRNNISDKLECKLKRAKYYSNGFFKRISIAIDFSFSQGDVNHVTGDINFAAILLKKRKTILTILDVGFMTTNSKLKKEILKFFWITLPIKRSSYVTTISNSAKNEILQYTNCNPNKIKVIYVPISASFKKVLKEFNTMEPVILQIGTKFNKNIDRLIESLIGMKCKLCIVGDLSEFQIGKLHNNNINFENYVNLTNEEIVQKYIDCDILSFVSTYEGFGMPIIEANATGRVVITSNILSMPEVAGNAAVLVDPYNIYEIRAAFDKVIFDMEYREKLVLNGFENCKRFNIRSISHEYSVLYKKIINRNK